MPRKAFWFLIPGTYIPAFVISTLAHSNWSAFAFLPWAGSWAWWMYTLTRDRTRHLAAARAVFRDTRYAAALAAYDDGLAARYAADLEHRYPVAPDAALACAILFTTTPTDSALAGWHDADGRMTAVHDLGTLAGIDFEDIMARMTEVIRHDSMQDVPQPGT